MQEQFLRTAMLLGEDAVEGLQKARVAVFGIGGVGGYTVEALARSGVGQIDLVDSDTVSRSNINRPDLKIVADVGYGFDHPSAFCDFEPVKVKDQKQMAEAEKIGVTLYNDALYAYFLDQENMPKAGKYQFSGYPIVTDNYKWVKLDKVTVTVEVEEKKVPTVKLSTTSLKLNTRLAGTEVMEIPFTFTNKTGYEGLSFNRFEIVNKYQDKVLVEEGYNEDTPVLLVRLENGAPKGTYKIDLYPLVNQEDGVSDVELGKITLTVNAYTADVKITTKTSGKLDTLNMDSCLRYSITKVENALGIEGNNLAQVSWAELEENVYDNNLFQIPDAIQKDASGKPYFELKLRDDVTYDLKKTYKVQVTYTVWDKHVTANYTFKVSQTALKAKVTAPGSIYLSGEKPLNVKLSLTSPDFAAIQRIEFNKSKSSKELAAALGFTGNRDVFVSSECPAEAALELELEKLGNLKNGATYSLVLNVYPKHHAKNASPLQVTVKMKVVK